MRPDRPVATRARPSWQRISALSLALGYTFLCGAWILASPPFANPDEEDHYLRALSLGRGEWVGEAASFPLSPDGGVRDMARERHFRSITTRVRVPVGHYPRGFACNAGRPELSASCTSQVHPPDPEGFALVWIGRYAPTSYLVPGALLRGARDARMGALVGRLGSCALPIALVLLAVTACGAAPLHRAGLLLALTPMAVATLASVGSSGLEIGAGVAFPALLLGLGRAPSRRGWAAAAAAGTLLALSRPTGPLWLALDAMAVTLLLGLAPLLSAWRASPRTANGAAAAIGLGVLGNFAWEAVHGAATEPSLSAAGMHGALRLAPTLAHEIVGAFGYLDTWVPEPLAWLWWGLASALLVIAVATGGRRERVALALGVFGALAVPLALQAIALHPTGFDLQGRHVLAGFALPLVLAAEVLRQRASRPACVLAWGLGCFVAVAQLGSWWIWARRHAVGSGGPLWFTGAAEWSPPWGWTPAITLAMAGAGMLLWASLPLGSSEEGVRTRKPASARSERPSRTAAD